MIAYPLKFKVSGSASAGIDTKWQVWKEGLPTIGSAVPPEFHGPGHAYSPEDLLGVAVMSCFLATFKVYAEKTGLTFDEIQTECTLTVDRVEKKPVAITKIHIDVKIVNPSNAAEAQKLLEESKTGCLVANALNVEKSFSIQIL